MASRLSLKQKTERSARRVELREQEVAKAVGDLKGAVQDVRATRKPLAAERAALSVLLEKAAKVKENGLKRAFLRAEASVRSAMFGSGNCCSANVRPLELLCRLGRRDPGDDVLGVKTLSWFAALSPTRRRQYGNGMRDRHNTTIAVDGITLLNRQRASSAKLQIHHCLR